MFYAIIFAAAVGAPATDFTPMFSVGPFDTLQQCAGVAAIGIGDEHNGLNTKQPDKDFRAACSTTNELVRHPGEPLYDLRMLAAIAGAPYPQDKQ